MPDGDLLALLGPSGSGKTTLLRIIAGLEVPNSGTVLLQGEDITQLSARERNVGFVFQHYALFRHMTVADNIGYGLRVRKAHKARIRWTAFIRAASWTSTFDPATCDLRSRAAPESMCAWPRSSAPALSCGRPPRRSKSASRCHRAPAPAP